MSGARRPRPYLAYLYFARCSFQRRAAYRLANWTGIAVNFFFFLIHAQVFFAFFGSRPSMLGWSAEDAVLYFATSESLLMVLGVFATPTGAELIERVRRGDIAVDLARPVAPWARFIAESYGSAIYYFLSRTIVLYGGAVLLYRLPLPLRPEILAAPVALALAIGVSAALLYIISSAAYWMEQAEGLVMILLLSMLALGGVAVPLDFYPSGLRLVADALPFRAVVYTPVAIATGKLTGGALAFGLAQQVLWLAVLVRSAAALERRGLARLAVQGG